MKFSTTITVAEKRRLVKSSSKFIVKGRKHAVRIHQISSNELHEMMTDTNTRPRDKSKILTVLANREMGELK
jgi:hypothetical protein